jgi:quinol monooxygenase YgiN
MAYVVSVLWRANEGEEERIARIVEEMTGPSRAEPGNLVYQAHRSFDDPRVFYFYERYVDEAAARAHSESDHFQRLVLGEAVPRLESRERALYETFPPDA